MINRILIRIKVVQMLYSYMLTQSQFRILPPPEKKNRDVRCAYNTYIDLLLLILKLSGQNVNTNGIKNPLSRLGRDNALSASGLTKSLASDDDVRQLILKRADGVDAYNRIIEPLFTKISSSEVYKDFAKKRKRDIPYEVRTWLTILRTVIATDPGVIAVARASEDYTAKGFAEGINMAVETIQDYSANITRPANALASLQDSLDRAHRLYHAMLMLPVAITRQQAERIDMAKEKYIPTDHDLNPSTRLIDNRLVEAISTNEDMARYLKDNPISWDSEYFLVKSLLDKILASDIYKRYLELPETDMASDCEFWRQVFKSIIFPSDELAEALEDKSVYWNDDLHIMGTFTLKTIKQIAASDNPTEVRMLPEYKDDEDREFGPELFSNAISNINTYREYINKFINPEQWDADRVAFMDIVIMVAAIAELTAFIKIPVPVTINEYVEIANFYSTPRSGQFVNGMLFSITKYLNEEGIITKPFA